MQFLHNVYGQVQKFVSTAATRWCPGEGFTEHDWRVNQRVDLATTPTNPMTAHVAYRCVLCTAVVTVELQLRTAPSGLSMTLRELALPPK